MCELVAHGVLEDPLHPMPHALEPLGHSRVDGKVLVNASGWNTLNYVALPCLAIAGSAALWLALRRRAAAAA